jgi:hypothetical protein
VFRIIVSVKGDFSLNGINHLISGMVNYVVFEVRTGFFHVILDERDHSLVAKTSQFADEGQKFTETDVLSQVLCYVSIYQTLHPLSFDCVGGGCSVNHP